MKSQGCKWLKMWGLGLRVLPLGFTVVGVQRTFGSF